MGSLFIRFALENRDEPDEKWYDRFNELLKQRKYSMLEKYFKDLKTPPEDTRVDLHMHSNASDGTWGPEALIRHVIDAGIGIMALTDHDTTANVEASWSIAREKGICFIPGVEVTSSYEGRFYHILGLGVDIHHTRLQEIIRHNVREFEIRNENEIHLLEKKYPNVSAIEYQNYVDNSSRGGWKSLNYVMDKGLCTHYKEYFKLFDGIDAKVETHLFQPDEVIRTIKEAGGCAVLAHPGAAFYDPDYRKIIDYMVTQGIQGLECYHPDNSREISEYCEAFCRRQGFMITAGSDCHGAFLPGRCLGKPDIKLSQLSL